ncbi:aminoglycoside phosphotransferase family protein [uncultured Desulfosarcina sp.]|uniref:aminoglycoside phosphotransferase family protein n=1 Tax=uncultured Desulfosarcina sp. TaxID=218289 RepID=UPI0029C907C6|nr:aminoglycoside phosphotransferase family protein [uncultured Desulfosarcina sp.]
MSVVSFRPDLPLAGSPERTVWRSVVETADSQLFVLEKIPSIIYGRKRRIAGVLKELSDQGLQQAGFYLPDVHGEFIPLIAHGLWQLCPYVGGVVLDRPAYVMDGWRGDAVAGFLIGLHAISSRNPAVFNTPPFSICAYIRDLFATLSQRNQTVAERYRPFMDHLEKRFFPERDRLPIRFCHGDLHPINIIWGKRSIRAVIDWEFCGIKPEAYDLANLLGCLGMEHPQSLAGPFARRLISRLREAEIFSHESWNTLHDLVLAIRFAWLSEWMRKNDQPMIRLEADYMSLLLEHRQDLKSILSRAA